MPASTASRDLAQPFARAKARIRSMVAWMLGAMSGDLNCINMQLSTGVCPHKHAVALKCNPRHALGVGTRGGYQGVSEALRRFMRARGLNANAWAKAAGVAPNALYNLFRGEAK